MHGGDRRDREWEDNEAYPPSPQSLGWPEPTDDFDAALQLAVTGYGPPQDGLRALATAEVAVLALPAPPGHALYVNPARPAGSVLEPDQLGETIAGGTRPDAPGPPSITG